MSEHSQTDEFDADDSDCPRGFPPLPSWLASRFLQPDEEVTWVCGPRFNPSWERYVTNPLLFVFALALAVAGWWACWRLLGQEPEVAIPLALASGAIVLGSIFVLGIFSGYFTRLVVTNSRLLILQGYEMCRSWGINELPRSMLRYRMSGGGVESPALDLDAIKNMLGSASDKFAESKTIMAFSKRLDQIKTRDKDRN
jgi:hypothetical protein